MIIYFADREMNILGHASSELRAGNTIIEDLKTDDVETGVASFSCTIGFDEESRAELEKMAVAGNYLLRSNNGENEFYTIIDSENDTKNRSISIYAEDAGLDLLNSRADAFEADASYVAEYYINKWLAQSSFEIGIFEIPRTITRKLKWESESTVTERLASIATQFGGYEISYSFATKGLEITHRYINFHKQRGKDEGVQLRLNKEIDRIVTTKTVANLATAFVCEGGIPEDEETPITLKGYAYDDGDFYVDTKTGTLKSRTAVEKWSRYVWETKLNEAADYDGHITRPYSYNTTSQQELCSHAVTELKKYCDMEVNFDVDIKKLPEGVRVGDRVNIIDDAGELYLSTRLLVLETSVIDNTITAKLGEHIIKQSGISQKVADLAAEFAKSTVSVERALTISNAAKGEAEEAFLSAEEALIKAEDAHQQATVAENYAEVAKNSAATAEAQAIAAKAAVDKVESSVQSIEKTVENAEKAAEAAQAAVETTQTLADEAKTAATNAQAAATEATNTAAAANAAAAEAKTNADTAQTISGEAKTAAQNASDIANAAKLDSEQAKEDVKTFGENLETYKTTFEADYARKSDLTETQSQLQAQIEVNAGKIETNVAQITVIDETTNNAKTLAEEAKGLAEDAQEAADQAKSDAVAAQTAADIAANAAATAQAEADTAKAAADTAQSVADQAKTDLETAKADLATVQGRVDATVEEIAEAQEAVNAAQAAADQADADAKAAAEAAQAAQNKADEAAETATNAQTTAENATTTANNALTNATEAKGNASDAIAAAQTAAQTAQEAQSLADTASANALGARQRANEAANTASQAQDVADQAKANAEKAQQDLAAAEAALEIVQSDISSTKEDVAQAEAAVVEAYNKAEEAWQEAQDAQDFADEAKGMANFAQGTADQAAADAAEAWNYAAEAKAAADQAQADVNALAIRVTTAETNITQTNERIDLCATKQEFADMTVGGRNLLLNTRTMRGENIKTDSVDLLENDTYKGGQVVFSSPNLNYRNILSFKQLYVECGETYTLSFDVKGASTVDVYWSNADSTATGAVEIKKSESDNGGTGSNSQGLHTVAGSNEWARRWVRWTFADSGDADIERMIRFYKNSGSLRLANIKLEKGTKATDWTPAPEDVTAEMLAEIESVRGNLTEQTSNVLVQAEGITLEHLKSYTEKGEYETFKQTTETALDLESGEIGMRFKSTEETISNVDKTVGDKFSQLEKFITFTEDGIKISTGDNAMTLELDNDIISFKKNGVQFGWWDGVDFHTGNIVVNVDEKAQFGSFAFVPRSDGSLMFLKVGG